MPYKNPEQRRAKQREYKNRIRGIQPIDALSSAKIESKKEISIVDINIETKKETAGIQTTDALDSPLLQKKYRPWGISPINNEGCHMPFIPLEVRPSMPAGYI